MKKDVILRFREVHGNKYDYSKVIYTKMIDKVEIICPKHGSFFQEPHSHLKGYGCPKCAIESRSEKKKDNTASFIEKARLVHGDKYDYSKVEYKSCKDKVCIICPEHGEFFQSPNCHLNGSGCSECYNAKRGVKQKCTKDDFVMKARDVHGEKYDYSRVEYKNNHTKVCIICPEHGEFWQVPFSHLRGSMCPECAKVKSGEGRRMTTDEFISRAREVHGDKYDYSNVEYKTCRDNIRIVCPVHGEFEQVPSYHLSGNGCQMCAKEMRESSYEREISEFIECLCPGNVVRNDRTVLSNEMELDILIPRFKVAFEFDGLYWHNEINKPSRSYHLSKTEECSRKGIRLIHIFEDEWIYKKEIVKSRIRNTLGLIVNKIHARKCEVRKVDGSVSRQFLNENHIQGYCPSKISYGLYYNGSLVSLMTFGKLRKNLGSKSSDGSYELLRFCNKLNTCVVGGATRLFSKFLSEIKPSSVISYADRRWSCGRLYDILGFRLSHTSQPSYFYVIGDRRENRFKYRKDKLISEGFDPSKSEHQIMLDRGIYRIYDCGCLVYKF